jgi:hypothetical protein
MDITLKQAKEMIKIEMETPYEFQVYSGPDGKGTFMFVLFLDETTNGKAFIKV